MSTKTDALEAATEVLRQSGQRWSAAQLAAKAGCPEGTMSGTLSYASRATLQHGGAGIYALKSDDGPGVRYQWRSSKPNESELWKHRKRQTTKPRASRAKKPDLKLTRHEVLPDVYVASNGDAYRLVPVEIQIAVIEKGTQ